MLGHRKVPHDIHYFHKTRVSVPNSTLLEYLLYAAGFRKKKYVYVHAWTCAKLFGNEMCVSINGNNGSAILGCLFFFLTQTHFDMQIFCKRINELVVFIIKALQCVISQPEHECVYIEECNVFSVLQRSKTNFSWNIKWIQFNMFSSNQIHLIQMFVNY